MSLEQERVNNINIQKLKGHQANMVDESINGHIEQQSVK
jgi:hypothetical protein